jgi:hypothetical protein
VIDLAPSIRAALLANATLAALLPAWKGSKSIHTRRPVPADAPLPMIVVSPDIGITDEDMVDQQLITVVRDIAVYGSNATAETYRAVEGIAYLVRDTFHRTRTAIAPSGWMVVDILAVGPFPAGTDDEQTVGRVVTLTMRLTPTT